MPNITKKLKGYLQGKKEVSEVERKNNEARITKIARKSLEDLIMIVGHSDRRRLEKIFKPEYANYLQYIIAKLSMELDDEFRDKIRIGLEAGYYRNSPENSVTTISVTTSSQFKGMRRSLEELRLYADSPYKFEPILKEMEIPRIELTVDKRIYR